MQSNWLNAFALMLKSEGEQALAFAVELKTELAKPTLPMSPEHLPQYIATNNIKPTTEGGGGAGGET